MTKPYFGICPIWSRNTMNNCSISMIDNTKVSTLAQIPPCSLIMSWIWVEHKRFYAIKAGPPLKIKLVKVKAILRPKLFYLGPPHSISEPAISNVYGFPHCSSLKCAHAFQCDRLQNNHTSLKLSIFFEMLHRKKLDIDHFKDFTTTMYKPLTTERDESNQQLAWIRDASHLIVVTALDQHS